MPLITTVHESLPYIDVEPTPSNRAAALSLINAEIPQNTNSHPNLPPLANCQFSSLIESEISRIEAKLPLNAIDLSRYEALEPPSTSPHSDEDHPETIRKWREALSQAYTSHTYLAGRQTNLMLLEQFGKNSWLIGNSQLEHVLRDLESELENRKEEIDIVVIERKNAQETMGAEVKGLEEVWKRGVGRVLETEVAAESIRREILERRRAGAS